MRPLIAATTVTIHTVMPVFLFGALIVLIREDVAISDGQLGAVVSAFFLASTIGAIPGGRLSDSIGPGAGMAIGMIGAAISMVGAAFIAIQWWHFAVWLFIGGAASGVGITSSNLALALQVSPARRGVAFGIKQASVSGASVLSGLAVPLLGLTVGWRWSFIAGVAGFGVLYLATHQRIDSSSQSQEAAKLGGHTAPIVALALLGTTAGFAAAAATATIGFFVESAVERGFATSTAGYVLSITSMAGIVGRIVWGWLADRREKGHLAFLAVLFLIGSFGFAFLGVVETVPLLILAGLISFGAGWSWSGLMFLVATIGSPGAPATATGVVATGGGIGGLLGPLLFGQVLEVSTYTVAWLVTASWVLTASILSMTTLMVWKRLLARRVAPA